MLIRLNIRPGDGIPWVGRITAMVDSGATWRIFAPADPVEREYLEEHLNARYGPHRLITYRSVPSLVAAVVNELDGEILRDPLP